MKQSIMVFSLLIVVVFASLALSSAESGDENAVLMARITMLDGSVLVMQQPRVEYSWAEVDDYRRYYNPPTQKCYSSVWLCWGGYKNHNAVEPLKTLSEVLFDYGKSTHPTVEVLKLRKLTFIHKDGTKTVLAVPGPIGNDGPSSDHVDQDLCTRGGATSAKEAPESLRTDAGIPITAMIYGGLRLVGQCGDDKKSPLCEVSLCLVGYVNPGDRAKAPRQIKFE